MVNEGSASSPQELQRDLGRCAWFMALWLIALAGSMACGQRGAFEGPARWDRADTDAPGIHELGLQDYPQRQEFRIRSGEGYRALGLELQPGMPMRLEVRSSKAVSPWGDPLERAGVGAPEAIRAKGAVLLRLGHKVIVVGSQTVIRASERVLPEVAVNRAAGQEELEFELSLAWGEPSRLYDPQLSTWGLRPGQGEERRPLRSRDREGSHVLTELPAGARVWIETPLARARQSDDDLRIPRLQAGAWLAQASDGQHKVVESSGLWSVQAGGQLSLQPNTRSGSKRAPPRIELFDPLGTREELLPIQSMRELETLELSVEPRRFIRLPLSVQAGDLLRVEIRGTNRLPPRAQGRAQNFGAHGALRTVPLALRNGDRGWLVPGGRERGVYAKIGDRLIELQGSDAFYAPVDGPVELGVNQCFDGGDWPSYAECRRRLKDWELDLRAVVGVSRGTVPDEP